MLKRNKMLVAFMLVAVLCMSIGFAAISDTLTASGTLGLNVDANGELNEDFNEDVYFSAVSDTIGQTNNAVTTGVSAAVDTSDNDKINITIADTTFTAVGQTVTITATIANEAPYAVALATPVITNANSQYFTVTGTLDANTLAATNGTTTLTIVVELDALPAATLSDAQFSVSVAATPAN